MFYNTLNLKDKSLKKSWRNTESQEEKVYLLFRKARKALTPTDVYALFKGKYPITSIRRAITNLSRKDLLAKTTERALGMYGMQNYKWKLNK